MTSENGDKIFVFALRWPDLNNPSLVTFDKHYTKSATLLTYRTLVVMIVFFFFFLHN